MSPAERFVRCASRIEIRDGNVRRVYRALPPDEGSRLLRTFSLLTARASWHAIKETVFPAETPRIRRAVVSSPTSVSKSTTPLPLVDGTARRDQSPARKDNDSTGQPAAMTGSSRRPSSAVPAASREDRTSRRPETDSSAAGNTNTDDKPLSKSITSMVPTIDTSAIRRASKPFSRAFALFYKTESLKYYVPGPESVLITMTISPTCSLRSPNIYATAVFDTATNTYHQMDFVFDVGVKIGKSVYNYKLPGERPRRSGDGDGGR